MVTLVPLGERMGNPYQKRIAKILWQSQLAIDIADTDKQYVVLANKSGTTYEVVFGPESVGLCAAWMASGKNMNRLRRQRFYDWNLSEVEWAKTQGIKVPDAP